jgi:hypothetical protein
MSAVNDSYMTLGIMAKEVSVIAASRLVKLANELGAEVGGDRWVNGVAKRMGIDQPYLYKLIIQERNSVGIDQLGKVVETLGLDWSYFLGDEEPGTYRDFLVRGRDARAQEFRANVERGIDAFVREHGVGRDAGLISRLRSKGPEIFKVLGVEHPTVIDVESVLQQLERQRRAEGIAYVPGSVEEHSWGVSFQRATGESRVERDGVSELWEAGLQRVLKDARWRDTPAEVVDMVRHVSHSHPEDLAKRTPAQVDSEVKEAIRAGREQLERKEEPNPIGLNGWRNIKVESSEGQAVLDHLIASGVKTPKKAMLFWTPEGYRIGTQHVPWEKAGELPVTRIQNARAKAANDDVETPSRPRR